LSFGFCLALHIFYFAFTSQSLSICDVAYSYLIAGKWQWRP
jgi:hypothetical protein